MEGAIKKVQEVRDALWVYKAIASLQDYKAEQRLTKMVEMLDEALAEMQPRVTAAMSENGVG